jgi:hypothetical protein
VTISIRLAFAAALSSAAVLMLGVPAGHASTDGDAPWCAVVNQGGNVMWECYYATVAECQPNVLAGNRGFCQRNPYYQAAAPQYYRGAPRDYGSTPPPGAGRWRYIGNGNYVGD